MSTAGITVILHAYQWPRDGATERALPTGLTLHEGRLITVREQEDAAIGAAALINRAATTVETDVFLVAEPCVSWSAAAIHTIAEVARHDLAIAASAKVLETPGASVANAWRSRCRLWGIPRFLFDLAGGLDGRFWSVGEVEDLEARLQMLGEKAVHVPLEGTWIGPESYPLPSTTFQLLAIRNRLMTVFKTYPLEALGPALALIVMRAIESAWGAARIDPEVFRFGTTVIPGNVRPADEAGTLVPLLALDSFLSELPSLLLERKRLQAISAERRGDHSSENTSSIDRDRLIMGERVPFERDLIDHLLSIRAAGCSQGLS